METVYQVGAVNVENSKERQEMQPMNVTQEWVSYPEAEKYCGLSHTTLWRYVSSGELKAARVGRSVRIHLPSLREFMEGRATENSPQRAKRGNQ
jgi:excisionase family DNA binding protein